MKALLQSKCGNDCFTEDGVPVTLELGTAPAGVKNEKEAYKLTATSRGITVTGFGESGLFYGVVTLKQLMKWDNRAAPCLLWKSWIDPTTPSAATRKNAATAPT